MLNTSTSPSHGQVEVDVRLRRDLDKQGNLSGVKKF